MKSYVRDFSHLRRDVRSVESIFVMIVLERQEMVFIVKNVLRILENSARTLRGARLGE